MIFNLNYETVKMTGCGLCPHLIHKHGIAICLASGNILEEKPVRNRTSTGDWVERSPAPVPNEKCAFNR